MFVHVVQFYTDKKFHIAPPHEDQSVSASFCYSKKLKGTEETNSK